MDLKEKGLEVGFEVLQWNPYPLKRAKVLIRCEHKTQWVTPRAQLKKSHCCRAGAYRGCPSPGSGNITASYFPTPEQRLLPGTLYLIRYLDDDGTHFKIGITRRTLQQRLGDSLVSILHLHTSTLGECFDLEQSLLHWAKANGHRYSSHSTTELLRADAIPYVLNTLQK